MAGAAGILVAGKVVRTEAEEALPDDEVVRRALSSYEPIERSVYVGETAPRVDRGNILACSCAYAPGAQLTGQARGSWQCAHPPHVPTGRRGPCGLCVRRAVPEPHV
jgi:hypothetical protein